MDITLNKARSLEKALKIWVNDSGNVLSTKKSVYMTVTKWSSMTADDIHNEVNETSGELKARVEKMVSFLGYINDIRKAIARANHDSGIDNILTEIKRLESENNIFSQLVGMYDSRYAIKTSMINDVKKVISESTENRDSPSINTMDDAYIKMLDQNILKNKREIQELRDEVHSLNNSVTISIDIPKEDLELLGFSYK